MTIEPHTLVLVSRSPKVFVNIAFQGLTEEKKCLLLTIVIIFRHAVNKTTKGKITTITIAGLRLRGPVGSSTQENAWFT